MIIADLLLCAGAPFLLLFGEYIADRIRAHRESR